MTETNTSTSTSTEYENLLLERSAFEQAGMTNKVEEWDYKIRLAEISQKYETVTFEDMAVAFGIEGLQKAVEDKQGQQAVQRRETKEKAIALLGDLYKSKKIAESKLWAFIDQNSWKFDNDPEMKSAIMEVVIPKVGKTLASVLRATFQIKKYEEHRVWERDKIAFIKIEKVEDYSQNDNPPMEELTKLVQAKNDNIFDELYIGYPMIDTVKQIDPIFFGTVRNPTEKIDELDGLGSDLFFNDSITLERLNTVNIGKMFKIAEWV